MSGEWLYPQTGGFHNFIHSRFRENHPSYLGVPGMQGSGEGWLPSDLEVLLCPADPSPAFKERMENFSVWPATLHVFSPWE